MDVSIDDDRTRQRVHDPQVRLAPRRRQGLTKALNAHLEVHQGLGLPVDLDERGRGHDPEAGVF